MICVQITVTGRVQGVFYRASTKNMALELNLNGWVRNEADGSVLIEAEGPKEQINQLINWCKIGPQYATVDQVIQKEVEKMNHQSFEIKH